MGDALAGRRDRPRGRGRGLSGVLRGRVRRPQRVRRAGRDGVEHDDRQGGHGRRLRVRPVTVRARLGRSPCRQDGPGPGVPRARFRHPADERVVVRGTGRPATRPHGRHGRRDPGVPRSAEHEAGEVRRRVLPDRRGDHGAGARPDRRADRARRVQRGHVARRRPRRRRHHRPWPVHRSLVERDHRPQPRHRRRQCRPRSGRVSVDGVG